jgi:hypothetical protein
MSRRYVGQPFDFGGVFPPSTYINAEAVPCDSCRSQRLPPDLEVSILLLICCGRLCCSAAIRHDSLGLLNVQEGHKASSHSGVESSRDPAACVSSLRLILLLGQASVTLFCRVPLPPYSCVGVVTTMTPIGHLQHARSFPSRALSPRLYRRRCTN